MPSIDLPLVDSLFGRDKYHTRDLQTHVGRAYEILRRCYFNRVRAQYRERLSRISSVRALEGFRNLWLATDYGIQALHLINRRIAELLDYTYVTAV